MNRKLIVNDGKKERELLLVGTMVVGRDPTCDISEADPLLSRRHVEFVASAREVVVRDLGSRNGILINGVKMTQAILHGGDVIQVGHLQVTFVEDSAAFVPLPDLDKDATAMAVPPAPRAATTPPPAISESPTVAIPSRAADAPTLPTGVSAPVTKPPAAAEDFDKTMPTARKPEAEDPDKTRFSAPPAPSKAGAPEKPAVQEKKPVEEKVEESPAPAPKTATVAGAHDPDKTRFSAPPAPGAKTPPPPAASTAAVEDPDKTRFVAPPAPKPAATPKEAPPAPAAPAAPIEDPDKTRFVAPPAPKPVATPKEAPAAPAAAATPIEDPDKTRSMAPPAPKPAAAPKPAPVAPAPKVVEKPVKPALAAATSAAEKPAKAPQHATARVATRPWTSFVLIQVAALAAVVFLATAIPLILWHNRMLNATAAAPTEGGSVAVVLALPVIIVLVGVWLTSRLITRQTMKALTELNEDIDMAVGGTLDAVDDPMGAAPVKDLADSVNALIARLRSTPDSEPPARPTAVKAPAPRAVGTEPSPALSQPRPAASKLSARIVTNARYVVSEATPGCAYLIGVRPEALVGQQLIDAIPEKDIADAVFQALSALGASGEHRSSVEPGARGYRVTIVVSREGKDKPLTIDLSADQGADA